MATLRGIKPGRKREQRTTSMMVMRHRRTGDPVVDNRVGVVPADPLSNNHSMDDHAYVDIEQNDEGTVTTPANTIPRG